MRVRTLGRMTRLKIVGAAPLAILLALVPWVARAQSEPAARDAAVVVAREAAALLDLGGLADGRLQAAVAPFRAAGAPRERLQRDLESADRAGSAALAGLPSQVTPDVRAALNVLSPADRAAVEAGRPISTQAEVYLRALDHLLHSNGGPPPAPAPPDPDRIAAELAGAGAPVSPRNEERSPEPILSEGGRAPFVALLVLAFAVAAAAVLLLKRRRPLNDAAGSDRPTRASSPAERLIERPSGASMQDLLDVSRRLTSAAASGNVDRLIVRHALELVPADGAAVVRNEDGQLVPAAESHSELIVAEGLSDSAIGRVAETGQTVVQVSATDTAIRNVPCALAAVPLVGGGRVLAVLVVIRRSTQPFDREERQVLEALAPVAAAAMHNAMQSRAVIEESLVDPLTNVGNRRRFDADLAAVLDDMHGTAALVMVDLDHFKSVNDTYGHPAGDAVLQQIAGVIERGIRPGDAAYRFGGEEFCVLLPETSLESAAEVAERLRAAVEATGFDIGGGTRLDRTASFGVAAARAGMTPAGLVAEADAALYEAKETGRNRVVTR